MLRKIAEYRIVGLKIAHICFLSLFLSGCAGFARGCTGFNARNFGSDWLIVQYDMNMNPKMCWKLHKVSVANEENSDGIHWLDNHTNAMAHIGGWYNYRQIANDNWAEMGKSLKVDASKCDDGAYTP